MPEHSSIRALLQLTLTPGFGPVLIERALGMFGSADDVLGASTSALRRIRGVGDERAQSLRKGLNESERLADRELAAAERLGVTLLAKGSAEYPALLAPIPSSPPILYVRGRFVLERDRYSVALVGSRHCTAYGVEQAERFATHLAQAGLTIVSGGARGIDTAAHRATLRTTGRTIVVSGCGLAHSYPPENAELFDRIVAEDRGAVVSELPLETSPSPENFPARNRIISGLSLGVLVIEAGRGSGALITARVATEDHGRDVMALPGRVDSAASEGSLDLIKSGGAALVTCHTDVLDLLESPARFLHAGVHDARYAPAEADPDGPALFEAPPKPVAALPLDLTETQRLIVEALSEPRSIDDLARATGLEASRLLADATVLEIRRVVVRSGSVLTRRGRG